MCSNKKHKHPFPFPPPRSPAPESRVEVHDVRARGERVVDLLAELGKVRRQD